MDWYEIALLIIGWLLGAVLFPLSINSIERQYQKEIDSAIKESLSLTGRLIFRIIQLIFFIIIFPAFLIVKALERCCPKAFKIAFLSELKFSSDAISSKNFPVLFKKATSYWWRKLTKPNKSLERD